LIYLSVGERDGLDIENPHTLNWGKNIFYVKNEWLKENSKQLRDNSWDRHEFVQKFVNMYGITPLASELGDDSGPNCIGSLKRIPIEALDFLVIKDTFKSEIDEIRANMPEHMRLFIYKGSNVKYVDLK
jgi:hypothetical protein